MVATIDLFIGDGYILIDVLLLTLGPGENGVYCDIYIFALEQTIMKLDVL